jgi:AcrR family transcriptional regulator
MVAAKSGIDRKEQIVSAAIDRLYSVGFEGFRMGDVAKDVGINNATLIHHLGSKEALINAVVERFTRRFEAVADATNTEGTPHEKLARHMASSVDLMKTTPEMFVVLNEIMVRARRDPEISRLVSVPIRSWRHHIVSLILSKGDEGDAAVRTKAEEIATACMAQLLGLGLLLNSTDPTDLQITPTLERSGSRAIAAVASLLADGS